MTLYNKFITYMDAIESWQLIFITEHVYNNIFIYLIIINKIIFKLFVFLTKNKKLKDIIKKNIRYFNNILGLLTFLIFFSEFSLVTHCSGLNRIDRLQNSNLSPLVSPPLFPDLDDLEENIINFSLPISVPSTNLDLYISQDLSINPHMDIPVSNDLKNLANSLINEKSIDLIDFQNKLLEDFPIDYGDDIEKVLRKDYQSYFNKNQQKTINEISKSPKGREIISVINRYNILNKKIKNMYIFLKDWSNIENNLNKDLNSAGDIKKKKSYKIFKAFIKGMKKLDKDYQNSRFPNFKEDKYLNNKLYNFYKIMYKFNSINYKITKK